MIFTSEQLNRYTIAAEAIFADEFRCIIDRIALPIEANQSLYALPDYILDIRRMTYLGDKMEAVTHRDLREALVSNSSIGVPRSYIFNNVGNFVIKLFPSPSLAIDSTQIDLLNPLVIRTQCIVEFYASSDGVNYRLPSYIRRRLIKAYVLGQAFLAEGKGQNIKAAKYWMKKWAALKEMYGIQIQDQLQVPRRLMANDGGMSGRFLGHPSLPIGMRGIGVDEGE